jgi:lysophospholipase L1-like esterase
LAYFLSIEAVMNFAKWLLGIGLVCLLSGFAAAQAPPAVVETKQETSGAVRQADSSSSKAETPKTESPKSEAPATESPKSAAEAEAAPRANSALVPKLAPAFMAKHNANLEVAKKGDIDVLFMGDSITDFWRNNGRNGATGDATPFAGKPVFDKYFGDMKVANFGIAGDTTQGVRWRLQNGEADGFRPKVIMLMIGTNNTSGKKNTPTEIAMGVAADVFELRKDFPEAKILLLGIFPRSTASSSVRGQIAEINKMISALNDGQHVVYMDIGAKFLAEDGSIPKDVMSDALHPTTKGYEIWAEAVKEPLAELMKE